MVFCLEENDHRGGKELYLFPLTQDNELFWDVTISRLSQFIKVSLDNHDLFKVLIGGI